MLNVFKALTLSNSKFQAAVTKLKLYVIVSTMAIVSLFIPLKFNVLTLTATITFEHETNHSHEVFKVPWQTRWGFNTILQVCLKNTCSFITMVT